MRIYIKHVTDTDYRFDFGFSDDLEKLEITEYPKGWTGHDVWEASVGYKQFKGIRYQP